jgi:hypothetical protein
MNMNQAWEKLFAELDIRARLENSGRFDLTADQIKKHTGKEPRNMSKWDARDARPEVLRKMSVTILPTSRQGYALVKGDGYSNLPQSEPAIYHSPQKLETFTTLHWREELTKESAAIDVAATSSMLKKFTGEQDLALTIRGRSGTSKFNFDFQGERKVHNIIVDRAQIEVDAGFEGESVWLIEAKMGEPSDFLVRQLFYPWRLWQTLTRKPVVPLFLTYTNKTFGLFRYAFASADNYHSLALQEKRWFTFDEPEGVASPGDLFEASRPVTPNENIPFPQADTLGTVIAAVELCATPENTAREISTALNFDERQGSYYTAAAEWLGFIARGGPRRELTSRGREFVAASRAQRFKILFKAVAATPVFREFIRRNLEGNPGTEPEIAEMILAKGYANKTTSRRRAKTVVAWIRWLWREHANLSWEAS